MLQPFAIISLFFILSHSKAHPSLLEFTMPSTNTPYVRSKRSPKHWPAAKLWSMAPDPMHKNMRLLWIPNRILLLPTLWFGFVVEPCNPHHSCHCPVNLSLPCETYSSIRLTHGSRTRDSLLSRHNYSATSLKLCSYVRVMHRSLLMTRNVVRLLPDSYSSICPVQGSLLVTHDVVRLLPNSLDISLAHPSPLL